MNPHQIKLAKQLLTVVVTSELVLGQINRKRYIRNAKQVELLTEENAQLQGALRTSYAQTEYLVTKLSTAGVVADEFDMIVFNELT